MKKSILRYSLITILMIFTVFPVVYGNEQGHQTIKLISPINESNYQNYGGALLIWDSDLDSFDIYLGASPDSLKIVKTNHTEKWYRTTQLDYGKIYFWKIVGKRELNDVSSSSWCFTTNNPCVSIHKYRLSTDPENYDTEFDWIREDSTLVLDLSKTAILLIDVWYDNKLPSPKSGGLAQVKHLVNIARRHGIQIFHLPHEGGLEKIWSEVRPHYGEIIVPTPWNEVLIEPYLEEQGITTLLYAGFDTSVCLLFSRPNSIIPLSKRGNYDIILLEDCVGALPLFDFWVIRGIAERHSITDVPKIAHALGDETIESLEPIPSPIPENIIFENAEFVWTVQGERDYKVDTLKNFPSPETALVLINIWNNFDNDGWLNRIKKNTRKNIYPLLEIARKEKIKIIHVPNGREIDPLCSPLEDEQIVKDQKELVETLKKNSINFIIYAGNLTNQTNFLFPLDPAIFCIENGGFGSFIIENCITVVETPETYNFEGMKKAFLIRTQYGGRQQLKTFDPLKFETINKR